MKKKFLIIQKRFWDSILLICFLLVLLSVAIYAVVNGYVQWQPIFTLIVLPIPIVILFYAVLASYINILEINEVGLKVRNTFKELKELAWHEIKDIYIYQFNGTDKIRVPYKVNKSGVHKHRKHGLYNFGGVLIYVPRKIPTKWIFVDDGRGDNGENIFEYLVPLQKGSIIKFRYSDKIVKNITKIHNKELISKTIGL